MSLSMCLREGECKLYTASVLIGRRVYESVVQQLSRLDGRYLGAYRHVRAEIHAVQCLQFTLYTFNVHSEPLAGAFIQSYNMCCIFQKKENQD